LNLGRAEGRKGRHRFVERFLKELEGEL